ncbi:MAG TPA: hypothetical protein VI583_10755 [Cyclobacteriaceae bacterium]|nr:hypothetical protein [Cyclobacteriaceae bacterium]
MRRIHLFEFEDLPWFPSMLRNYMTDFLQFGANAFNVYKDLVPVISEIMKKLGKNTIIDLGSGGGGGWLRLEQQLKPHISGLQILLTDQFPNIPAFERTVKQDPEVFKYHPGPVDARNVPSDLAGIRTLFLSLHHFRYEDARKIIQDSVTKSMPIMIVEIQQRNLFSLIPMILSPINVLLTTLFIQPFRLGRILFTYLIPIIPTVIMWDGIVSVLRTYTIKELLRMVEETENNSLFTWDIRITKKGPRGVMYLVGYRK